MMIIAASSSSFLCPSPHFLGSVSAVGTSSPAPRLVGVRSPRFVAAYTSAERSRTSYPCSSSSKMASSASLYEVLGIPMGATCQDIKSAYRRLVRVCHPDVVTVDRKGKSADEFMKIHAAYSTLSDPKKRADYDRNLFSMRRPFNSSSTVSSGSGVSGYTCRSWETDQCW